jgi:hypothetical protein
VTSLGSGRFAASLDDQFIVASSRQPLLDGARELLRRGYPPAALMTMRHDGAGHVSFKPAALGKLARLTVKERDCGGLRLEAWTPFDAPAAFPGLAKDERNEGEG